MHRGWIVVAALAFGGCGESSDDDLDPPVVGCVEAEPPLGPQAIYLAFDGVTLESAPDGEDDATALLSSFVSAPTAFPPFRSADPNRQQIIDTLTADVQTILSPFGATVTTVRPEGDHMMMVFAGQDGGALLGLMRLDCDHRVRNDVVIFFENVADPERGRYAPANETVFGVTRSIGLAKSSGPGHPCSCDPSGTCDNTALCEPTREAEVSFSECPGTGAVQDEVAAFVEVFGCAR